MKKWLSKLNETRYLVVFLLCVANTICYADRTNIGIAVPLFVPDKEDRGVVLSAFFYGYILTQIPAGYFASRFGVKSVLAFGVIVWTIFDTSTIFVSGSLPLLILVRACMGRSVAWCLTILLFVVTVTTDGWLSKHPFNSQKS